MPKPMTDAQSKVYEFILYHLVKCFTLPTFAEISHGCKFSSPNAAQEHIKALIKKGWLEKASKKRKKLNYKPIYIELTITRTEDV
tara:strand:+ start:274 stop:528 length:255 start_codon:yes stop_codon:yes gene_type:complete